MVRTGASGPVLRGGGGTLRRERTVRGAEAPRAEAEGPCGARARCTSRDGLRAEGEVRGAVRNDERATGKMGTAELRGGCAGAIRAG